MQRLLLKANFPSGPHDYEIHTLCQYTLGKRIAISLFCISGSSVFLMYDESIIKSDLSNIWITFFQGQSPFPLNCHGGAGLDARGSRASRSARDIFYGSLARGETDVFRFLLCAVSVVNHDRKGIEVC